MLPKTESRTKKVITRKKTTIFGPLLVQVKILYPGDSFGELALINNRPRLATIISLDSTTHLISLSKTEFNRILKRIEEHKMLREMGFFA
jgi:CRP-like cAMP-binding protein